MTSTDCMQLLRGAERRAKKHPRNQSNGRSQSMTSSPLGKGRTARLLSLLNVEVHHSETDSQCNIFTDHDSQSDASLSPKKRGVKEKIKSKPSHRRRTFFGLYSK